MTGRRVVVSQAIAGQSPCLVYSLIAWGGAGRATSVQALRFPTQKRGNEYQREPATPGERLDCASPQWKLEKVMFFLH